MSFRRGIQSVYSRHQGQQSRVDFASPMTTVRRVHICQTNCGINNESSEENRPADHPQAPLVHQQLYSTAHGG